MLKAFKARTSMSEICKMKAPFRRITKYNKVKAATRYGRLCLRFKFYAILYNSFCNKYCKLITDQ
jgi:hypothetical protein